MAHLTIDGTPQELRLDFRALREAERLMTRSVLEVLGQHGAMFKLDELAALCWGAWRRTEPRLSFNVAQSRVEACIERDGLLVVQTAVAEALMESGLLARPDARAEEEGRPPLPGTGRPNLDAPAPTPSTS